jgi:hypothetical protein
MISRMANTTFKTQTLDRAHVVIERASKILDGKAKTIAFSNDWLRETFIKNGLAKPQQVIINETALRSLAAAIGACSRGRMYAEFYSASESCADLGINRGITVKQYPRMLENVFVSEAKPTFARETITEGESTGSDRGMQPWAAVNLR